MYKVGRSRTPQGVRGLKLRRTRRPSMLPGRTPQGVRGLKLPCLGLLIVEAVSHSARSAWIETASLMPGVMCALVALRKECVD